MSPFRCFEIFKVDDRFPARFHAQWIAVSFGKAVDKIYLGIEIFYPENGIFVELFQITGLVIIDEFLDDFFLLFVFCYAGSFFEPIYNLLDSFGIESAHFIGFFYDFSVTFYQTTIQSVRDRSFVFGIFHFVVKRFCLGLSHTIVIIACRGDDEVLIGSLIYSFGHDRGIENNRSQCIE